MSNLALEVSSVWKKFRRGQLHDSLRDLIPSMAKRICGNGTKGAHLDARDFWALKDVSFHLDRGEALGIIGPNGAGKSTMLKILSRILKPTKGEMKVNGRLSALIEVSAGFHPDLTGRENIYLNGSILGMKKREIDSKLDRIIEFSGIESFIDTPVKRYSSGMQARLGFSVAAHLDPEILLIDEVLSVGDVAFQNRCIKNMKEKLNNGTTIIFVSHNLPAVVDLCPKTLVLHLGERIFLGESREATGQYMKAISNGSLDCPVGSVTVTHHRMGTTGENSLTPGDQFEFELGLSFRERITGPTFSIWIYRVSDNLPIYDVAAQELGVLPRTYETDEKIVVRFKGRANLLRGLYSLGFNVYLPSEQRFLISMPSLYQFYVHETASYAGIADLACIATESSS